MTKNKHNASDRALDHAATAEHAESAEHAAHGVTHDHSETRKHDDAGKDRLFEGRQQHDLAEKKSEKTRLARDVDEHHHDRDETGAEPGPGM